MPNPLHSDAAQAVPRRLRISIEHTAGKSSGTSAEFGNRKRPKRPIPCRFENGTQDKVLNRALRDLISVTREF